MLMRNLTILALCAVPLSGAKASQSLSKSMAECAGLFLAASEWFDASDARADQMLYVAGVWSEAAREQAASEGHRDAVPRVAAHERAKYEEWVGRGRMTVFSDDFKDWGGYCRALGKSRGLDIDLS